MALTIDAAVGDSLPGQERAEAELSAEALTEFTRFHTELSPEQQASLLAENPFEMKNTEMTDGITLPQLEALVYLRGHPADEEDAVGVEASIIEEVGTNGNTTRRRLFAVLGATVALALAGVGISNLPPRSQRPAEVASAPAADTADDSLPEPATPVDSELANDFFLRVFDEERLTAEMDASLSDPAEYANTMFKFIAQAAVTTPEIRQQYIDLFTAETEMNPKSELDAYLDALNEAYLDSGLDAFNWVQSVTDTPVSDEHPVFEFSEEGFSPQDWVLVLDAVGDGRGRLIMVFRDRPNDPDFEGFGAGQRLHDFRSVGRDETSATNAITQVIAEQ